MVKRKRNEVVFPNAAGIDVGAASHYVAVPADAAADGVREFGAMTADLHAMADWLLGLRRRCRRARINRRVLDPGVRHIGTARATVWLVDARQLKYVPGCKSDVQDCQWLQTLMSFGLLRAAWRPAGDVCAIRAIARQREVLLVEQASWIQRMQKTLVEKNIQLTEVLSDIMVELTHKWEGNGQRK